MTETNTFYGSESQQIEKKNFFSTPSSNNSQSRTTPSQAYCSQTFLGNGLLDMTDVYDAVDEERPATRSNSDTSSAKRARIESQARARVYAQSGIQAYIRLMLRITSNASTDWWNEKD